MESAHNYWMKKAIKLAKIGATKGEVPIGAILVRHSEDLGTDIIVADAVHNDVCPQKIAEAYNSKETLNDPTAHAEILVIREAAKKLNNWRLLDTILYITAEPCAMCAGAIIQSRIPLIVYGCREERFGAVDSSYQLFNDPRSNHHPEVISGILEKECKDLLQAFFETLRRGGRVVEGGSLENCSTGNCTGGSNPSLSAKT